MTIAAREEIRTEAVIEIRGLAKDYREGEASSTSPSSPSGQRSSGS
jgi:hypothetical protein